MSIPEGVSECAEDSASNVDILKHFQDDRNSVSDVSVNNRFAVSTRLYSLPVPVQRRTFRIPIA